ncbi:uncharacterized protein LOC144655267 [Oculina patagonica]
MVEIENIDFLFPSWITSNLKAINNRWEMCWQTFNNCQAMIMRRVSQAREFVTKAKKFSVNHPVIAMFLAVVAVLGFIPILASFSIVSGSFVVIFVTAFTVFQGVVVVSLVPFLAVLVPILMIGGTAAIFAYLAYRSVMKILRIIKRISMRLKEILSSMVPSQIRGKPVRFRGYKGKSHAIPQKSHRRYEAFPSTDEEPFEEELFNSSPDWF